MQSLLRARPLIKQASPRKPTSRQLHFFATSRPGLKSGFFSAKPTRSATTNNYQTLKRGFGNYGGWGQPSRVQSSSRMLSTLIIINTSVFATWYYAKATNDSKLGKFLRENAVLSWSNIKANRYWTLVTAAFSHHDFMHILFNMLALNTFGSVLCMAGGIGVGAPHVAALFLGSALAGSAAWMYQRRPQTDKRWGPFAQHGLASSSACLGASGAVMGFATVATCLAPMLRMSFILIPVGIPMFVMTGGFIAVDLFYLGKNDLIGRSAHLGGALFGAAYYLAFLRRFGGISHIGRQLTRRRY
jgi:membrane associated rhomboid family serine protease